MTAVPNKPKTPLKSFRIPQDLYLGAQAKAAENGETVSDVVRRALEEYVGDGEVSEGPARLDP